MERFFLLSTANPSSTGNDLNAVSCTSSANCLAVGSCQDFRGQFELMAEVWDGSNWSFENTANPAGTLPALRGLSCSSPGVCTAVGSFKTVPGGVTDTLAERFVSAG